MPASAEFLLEIRTQLDSTATIAAAKKEFASLSKQASSTRAAIESAVSGLTTAGWGIPPITPEIDNSALLAQTRDTVAVVSTDLTKITGEFRTHINAWVAEFSQATTVASSNVKKLNADTLAARKVLSTSDKPISFKFDGDIDAQLARIKKRIEDTAKTNPTVDVSAMKAAYATLSFEAKRFGDEGIRAARRVQDSLDALAAAGIRPALDGVGDLSKKIAIVEQAAQDAAVDARTLGFSFDFKEAEANLKRLTDNLIALDAAEAGRNAAVQTIGDVRADTPGLSPGAGQSLTNAETRLLNIKELLREVSRQEVNIDIDVQNVDMTSFDKIRAEIARLQGMAGTVDSPIDANDIATSTAQMRKMLVSVRDIQIAAARSAGATVPEIAKISAAYAEAEADAVRLARTAQKHIAKTTVASQSAIRIIQDAPFGMMGITNNIQQFSEEFGRLKGQIDPITNKAATFGQTWKAVLGGMISGPMAIPLVITIITTLILSHDKLAMAIKKVGIEFGLTSRTIGDDLKAQQKGFEAAAKAIIDSMNPAEVEAFGNAAISSMAPLNAALNDNIGIWDSAGSGVRSFATVLNQASALMQGPAVFASNKLQTSTVTLGEGIDAMSMSAKDAELVVTGLGKMIDAADAAASEQAGWRILLDNLDKTGDKAQATALRLNLLKDSMKAINEMRLDTRRFEAEAIEDTRERAIALAQVAADAATVGFDEQYRANRQVILENYNRGAHGERGSERGRLTLRARLRELDAADRALRAAAAASAGRQLSDEITKEDARDSRDSRRDANAATRDTNRAAAAERRQEAAARRAEALSDRYRRLREQTASVHQDAMVRLAAEGYRGQLAELDKYLLQQKHKLSEARDTFITDAGTTRRGFEDEVAAIIAAEEAVTAAVTFEKLKAGLAFTMGSIASDLAILNSNLSASTARMVAQNEYLIFNPIAKAQQALRAVTEDYTAQIMSAQAAMDSLDRQIQALDSYRLAAPNQFGLEQAAELDRMEAEWKGYRAQVELLNVQLASKVRQAQIEIRNAIRDQVYAMEDARRASADFTRETERMYDEITERGQSSRPVWLQAIAEETESHSYRIWAARNALADDLRSENARWLEQERTLASQLEEARLDQEQARANAEENPSFDNFNAADVADAGADAARLALEDAEKAHELRRLAIAKKGADDRRKIEIENRRAIYSQVVGAISQFASASDSLYNTWRSQREAELEREGVDADERTRILNEEGRKRFLITKRLRVAEAIANTISAGVSAWRFGNATGGPVLGGIMLAAALATGYAQVRQLNSLQPDGSGASGGSASSGIGGYTTLNGTVTSERVSNFERSAGTLLPVNQSNAFDAAASRMEDAASRIEATGYNLQAITTPATAEANFEVARKRQAALNQ